MPPGRSNGAETKPRFSAENPFDLIGLAVAAAFAAGAVLLAVATDPVEMAADVAFLSALVIPLLYPAPVRHRLMLGLVLIGAWVLTIALLAAIPELVEPAPSVSQAVGGAVFNGVEYQGRSVALAISFLFVLAVLVAGLGLRRERPPSSPFPSAPAATPAASGWWLVALTAGAVLPFVPSTDGYFQLQRQLIPDWDVSNLELWDYLVTQGAVPMRDFFFPYGGQWVFALIPEGPWLRWGTQVAMIALAAWALWRLTGRDLWRAAACVLALALIATWNPAVWRFLPGFLLPLTYAAMGPARGRLSAEHALFGAVCLFALLYEADLLLYGLAGCGLVLLGEVVSGALPLKPRRVVGGLALDALPVAAAVAATLGVWAATDTLDGNLDFFAHLGATTASGAVQLEPQIRLDPSIDSIYVALPALLVAGGFALARVNRRAASCVLLAAAGVTLIFAFKHLIRPVDKLPLIVIVAGAWAAILLWRPRAFAPTVGAATLGVCLILLIQDDRGFTNLAENGVKSPVRLFELGQTAFDASDLQRSADNRFAEPSYSRYQEAGVAAQFRAAAARPDGSVPSFAVLGDAPLVYLFFDQTPPFHDQLYDAAPLFQQERMVESLRELDPKLLVWRQHYEIDAVPYEVRDPLVFEWAIRNYAPLDPKTANKDSFVDVLRRRRAGEPIAADYWAASLGITYLGYIPSYSTADELPSCDKGPDCAPVAVFENESTPADTDVGVGVIDRAGPDYAFSFRVREGVDSYPVRLDRLWFWPLIEQQPELIASEEGWSVKVVRVDGSDNLY